MKTYKLVANQETVDYLQRLHFDINMRKNIITTLLSSNTDESVFTGKPFIKYSEELARLEAEYEIAKAEFELYYLPEELRGKHEYTWSIDFITNEVTLEIKCECGVEAYELSKEK